LILLQSLLRAFVLYGCLAILIYIVSLILIKQAVEAANAVFIFFVFFHTYGIVYNYLLALDFFQIEHYTLLPFFLLLALYASWLVSKISAPYSDHFLNSFTFIIGVLLIFNIIKIVPVELEKHAKQQPNIPSTSVTSNSSMKGYPDIFYIVFDEFSGFEPMRRYWNNEEVDDFSLFLQSNGFFVAEQSYGSSIITLHEMATRLNYEVYPCCDLDKYAEIYYEHISDNKVMHYLKSKGYSTAVFEELTIPKAYPAMQSIIADYSFKDVPYTIISTVGSGELIDEFGRLVANYSMLRAFPISHETSYSGHRDKILYVTNKIANLDEIQSPKFIYVHLLFPHLPFMFDKNGNVLDARFQSNWSYYLGQYNYSIKIAEEMIGNILSNADPKRPPVIIFQSDHGARNIDYGSVTLDDFPEEYKTSIVFTLYIPGYDTSNLPQDIDPIDTFPIVFNYLFDDNISLKSVPTPIIEEGDGKDLP
jgi:hypothetical protein